MEKEKIVEVVNKTKLLLESVKREGMSDLIQYMEEKGFFEAPASTKFHGSFPGGLVVHCYKLYLQFKKHCQAYKINFPEESMIICAFGHDLCKVGLYIQQTSQYCLEGHVYKWNPHNGKGHSTLSIKRLKQFIELTHDEETIIQYHMGLYLTTEFSARSGEYSLQEMVDEYNRVKLAKLFYFCDDMSSTFLEG